MRDISEKCLEVGSREIKCILKNDFIRNHMMVEYPTDSGEMNVTFTSDAVKYMAKRRIMKRAETISTTVLYSVGITMLIYFIYVFCMKCAYLM